VGFTSECGRIDEQTNEEFYMLEVLNVEFSQNDEGETVAIVTLGTIIDPTEAGNLVAMIGESYQLTQ
jgi:hypothetical protein